MFAHTYAKDNDTQSLGFGVVKQASTRTLCVSRSHVDERRVRKSITKKKEETFNLSTPKRTIDTAVSRFKFSHTNYN